LRKALKIFNQILQINPENSVALCNKGVIFSKLGKYEQALRCYDLALNFDRTFEKAKINRAKLLTKVRIISDITDNLNKMKKHRIR